MYLPRLCRALDACAVTLQELLKQSVPVDTGALRDSITVSAEADDRRIIISVDLLNYWRWITKVGTHRLVKEPVPVPEVCRLSPTILIDRYRSLNGAIEAIRMELDNALEADILDELNGFDG